MCLTPRPEVKNAKRRPCGFLVRWALVVTGDNSSEAVIADLLQIIADIQARRGYPPSIREITASLGFASTSTTHKYMKIAQHRGLLTMDPRVPRSVVLTVAHSR